MVFLKRFYAEGFKSFATPISLSFNNQMIGIVGPNGSGKSNIVDALKWTIGEQSIKSLRGREKENLIFMGSKTMPEAPYAMVTLVFDNRSRVLHADFDEVSVTRKLIRRTGESQFFINEQPAKLKDIQNMFLDTGLSRGSLGIISQGTVSWFAEAKPEDRRKMFEEAAGISRYTKNKLESQNSLDKSMQHLLRVQDLLTDKEKTIRQLTKQAEKAKLYQEKQAKLEEIDVTIMVQDLLEWKDEMRDLEADTQTLSNQATVMQQEIAEKQILLDDATGKFNQADQDVDQAQQEKEQLLNEIHALEQKKLLFDQRLADRLNSDNIRERSESYKNLIIQTEQEHHHLFQKNEIDQAALHEAKEEHQKILQNREQVFQERSRLFQKINACENQLENLNRQKQNLNDYGVQVVLKNQSVLPGICGTVASLIKVPEKYEIAIQTALGRATQNIIVENRETALSTIDFLKRNNSGRATFLPLDTIKPKAVKPESLAILQQLDGYLAIANQVVETAPKYQLVLDHLLGNIILADDVQNGTNIAQMTYQAYKVISLDGDVNFPGGAIQGGAKNKSAVASFNLDEKIASLSEELSTLKDTSVVANVEYEKLNDEEHKWNAVIQNKTIALNSNQLRLAQLEQLIQRYKSEFEALTKTSFDAANQPVDENSLQTTLLQKKSLFDQVSEKLNLALESKTLYKEKFETLQFNLKEIRCKFDNLNAKLANKTEKLAKMRYDYDTTEDRIINNYKLTLETAIEKFNKPLQMSLEDGRALVHQLKAEIAALGNINFAAVEELTKIEAEYAEIKAEFEAVEKAVNELRTAIEQLDQKARADLMNIITKVNNIMPTIFKDLFGGGQCQIVFTDPKQVLDSGIEVIVHPPGKKVSNLMLLSGGEKTLVALSVLFAILKSSAFPLVVLDEAEAALDQYNVDLFAKMIRDYSDQTQFMIITHRPGTMKMCNVLYGTTMQTPGITSIFKTDLGTIREGEQK